MEEQKKQNKITQMNPTPTTGDKLKATLKSVVPPAMGGTAGTGQPKAVTAQEEAYEREARQQEKRAGGGGISGAGYGGGVGTEMGAGAGGGNSGGMGAGAHGGVLHRETGTIVEDRPVAKEVRQEFVEHRPVAQHVETVTRITGESAVEGGMRLEATGPASERVVREGGVREAAGMGAGGGVGGGMGGRGTMTDEERLEAERMGSGRGTGAGGIGGTGRGSI